MASASRMRHLQTRQIRQVFLELAVCFAEIHLDYWKRDPLALDSL
jgi:hypothetical protein